MTWWQRRIYRSGTKITLELEEMKQRNFRGRPRWKGIIQRYSSFDAVPDRIEREPAEYGTGDLGAEQGNEIKEEEYNEFYTFIGHDHDAPLFRLHFSK